MREANDPTAVPAPATGRTAVVVLHGIGDQRPQATVREVAHRYVDFCRTPPGAGPAPLYAVPDVTDATFELHSYVVPEDEGNPRQVDFYEGYWAPDVTGTRWTHLVRWGRRLLLRAPWSVPPRLRAYWVGAWVGAVMGVVAVVLVGQRLRDVPQADGTWWLPVALALLSAGLGSWLLLGLGDAARYFDDRTDNVTVRHAIRRDIVHLLEVLHETERYDGIVVVGHSLGGAVAYDALRILWARRTRFLDVLPFVDSLGTQHARHRLLAATPVPRVPYGPPFGGPVWRVTDLITIGSPIAYPSVLIARTHPSLAELIQERALPTAPPQPVGGLPDRFWYLSEHGREARLHHGAMFAATSWTNIYARGDVVGGPVVDLGPDVANHELSRGLWTRIPGLSHVSYWRRRELWDAVLTAPGWPRSVPRPAPAGVDTPAGPADAR